MPRLLGCQAVRVPRAWVGVCVCVREREYAAEYAAERRFVHKAEERASQWLAGRPRWSATSLLSPRTRPSMLDYSKVTARSWCSSHVSRSGLNLRRVSHLQQPALKSVVAYCILLLVAAQIPVFRDPTCTDNSCTIPVLWINNLTITRLPCPVTCRCYMKVQFV